MTGGMTRSKRTLRGPLSLKGETMTGRDWCEVLFSLFVIVAIISLIDTHTGLSDRWRQWFADRSAKGIRQTILAEHEWALSGFDALHRRTDSDRASRSEANKRISHLEGLCRVYDARLTDQHNRMNHFALACDNDADHTAIKDAQTEIRDLIRRVHLLDQWCEDHQQISCNVNDDHWKAIHRASNEIGNLIVRVDQHRDLLNQHSTDLTTCRNQTHQLCEVGTSMSSNQLACVNIVEDHEAKLDSMREVIESLVAAHNNVAVQVQQLTCRVMPEIVN
jgi:chromosome segregation ATPase